MSLSNNFITRTADGALVQRREAEHLSFPKFGDATSFARNWKTARRTTVLGSGRRTECDAWWREIENVDVSFESLMETGPLFQQYDGKVQLAALKSIPEMLHRKIELVEEQRRHHVRKASDENDPTGVQD